MLLALIATAIAADPRAEAERLQEEIRGLARNGRWAGVDLAWHQLLATGANPSTEACQLAADAAFQLGLVDQVLLRLPCAPDTDDNRALAARLQAENGRVVLFARRGDPLDPDVMPFEPVAARAITDARDQLANDGFYRGMLPVGTYRLGDAQWTLEAGALLVSRSSGAADTGPVDAVPHLGPFGGRWLDVHLSPRDVGAAVRSDPDTAGGWRTGGLLTGIGVVAIGVGAGSIAASRLFPAPEILATSCTVPLPQPEPFDPQPVWVAGGIGVAVAGATSVGFGWALRAASARRFRASLTN